MTEETNTKTPSQLSQVQNEELKDILDLEEGFFNGEGEALLGSLNEQEENDAILLCDVNVPETCEPSSEVGNDIFTRSTKKPRLIDRFLDQSDQQPSRIPVDSIPSTVAELDSSSHNATPGDYSGTPYNNQANNVEKDTDEERKKASFTKKFFKKDEEGLFWICLLCALKNVMGRISANSSTKKLADHLLTHDVKADNWRMSYNPEFESMKINSRTTFNQRKLADLLCCRIVSVGEISILKVEEEYFILYSKVLAPDYDPP